jgi:hypothetical protein
MRIVDRVRRAMGTEAVTHPRVRPGSARLFQRETRHKNETMKAINDSRAERLISGVCRSVSRWSPRSLFGSSTSSSPRASIALAVWCRPTFDQLTRHCTAGCTALRPRVAAQLPLLRSDRIESNRSTDWQPTCAHPATQVQCKAALAQAVMSCPQSVRWKACPAGSI